MDVVAGGKWPAQHPPLASISFATLGVLVVGLGAEHSPPKVVFGVVALEDRRVKAAV